MRNACVAAVATLAVCAASHHRVNADDDTIARGALGIDKWAFIVGISTHKHQELKLEWAHRDAQELQKLLISPTGGAFDPDNIETLVNEEATTSEILARLRNFSKKPTQDDVVLLFFSCHGAPDPDRSNVLYLVTHDTDPSDLAGTALPMREIKASLEDYLLAERVIILADTCHSGGISVPGGKLVRPASADGVNNYMQQLSNSRRGMAWLTSGEKQDISREGQQWGGGHGVFTHFLLEGMNGLADSDPSDGIVSLGELFEYVQREVKDDPRTGQRPTMNPDVFDRRFPMAVTGTATAEQHLGLGRRLYEIGWTVNEDRPFESATRHLSEAANLFRAAGKREKQAEAQLLCAKSHLAVQEYERALDQLHDIATWAGPDTPVDLQYWLGWANICMDRSDLAHKHLQTYALQGVAEKLATDALVRTTEESPQTMGKTYALLIGVGDYQDSRISDLRGPPNDVGLWENMLLSKWGIPAEDVVALVDAEATCEDVRHHLERLASTARPEDKFIFLFSGHSTSSRVPDDSFLIFGDTAIESDAIKFSISATELFDSMRKIPASTHVFIDADPNLAWIDLLQTRPHSFTYFGASIAGGHAFEQQFEDNIFGDFSIAVSRGLEEMPRSHSSLLDSVQSFYRQYHRDAVPAFYGNRDDAALSPKTNDRNLKATMLRQLLAEPVLYIARGCSRPGSSSPWP